MAVSVLAEKLPLIGVISPEIGAMSSDGCDKNLSVDDCISASERVEILALSNFTAIFWNPLLKTRERLVYFV